MRNLKIKKLTKESYMDNYDERMAEYEENNYIGQCGNFYVIHYRNTQGGNAVRICPIIDEFNPSYGIINKYDILDEWFDLTADDVIDLLKDLRSEFDHVDISINVLNNDREYYIIKSALEVL